MGLPPTHARPLGCRVFRGAEIVLGCNHESQHEKRGKRSPANNNCQTEFKGFGGSKLFEISKGKKAAASAMACNSTSHPITRLRLETFNLDHGKAASGFLRFMHIDAIAVV